MKKLLIFTLSLLLFGTSCSIEKRVHSPGYHVDWHGNADRVQESKQQLRVNAKELNSISKISSPFELKESSTEHNISFNDSKENRPKASVEELIEKVKSFTSKESNKLHELNKHAKSKRKKEEIDKSQTDTRESEPSAVISLILSILSVFLPPLAIASLLLSKKSLDNIEANPNKYRGKFIANLARSISLVVIWIWAIILIAALIALIIVGILAIFFLMGVG